MKSIEMKYSSYFDNITDDTFFNADETNKINSLALLKNIGNIL